MRTLRLAQTIGLLLVGAGCTDDPTLPEQLLGTWDLAYLNSYQVPGNVKSCGTRMTPEGIPYLACDSTYIASGQLTLQPDNRCVQTIMYETGAFTRSCTYVVNKNSGSIQYEGGEGFDLGVQGDDLWLSGPPCTFQDIDCSQYTEQYHKRKS